MAEIDDILPVSSGMEITEDMPDDVYYGTSSELFPEEDLPSEEDTTFPLSEDDRKKLTWYKEKNEFLRNSPLFRELDLDAFLRLIFCRDEYGFEELPFEEEWCEAYDWWTSNERGTKRPAEYGYVYNGIAQAIYGKRQAEKKNKTFVVTSRAEQLNEIKQHPFVIMSPVSYTGKRRTKTNARYLYAMAIDIDSVDAENVDNLIYQSDPTRKYITFPQPNIIVNSGGGIHVYYLLESPAPMFNDVYPILNKVKKELTRRVWNVGTTHENPDKPQFQGNCQGFRLPGTQTKQRQPVTAFLNINPNAKRYYSVSDLAFGGGGWITDNELELVKKGKYNPHRTTLKQARELWPEWYERRIVLKTTPSRWYVNRGLYDWWKQKIFRYASVGHRYFCLMTLAIYAKKCQQLTYEQYKAVYAERLKGLSEIQIQNRYKKRKGVTEEEFRKDVMDFVAVLDGLSYTRKPEDRFTEQDALDAAEAYKDCYCTFPLDDLRAITGVEIERDKTRRFRKQNAHLERNRIVQNAMDPDGKWRNKDGRPTEKAAVQKWRAEHPDSHNKSQCARDCGLSWPTVTKWWDKLENSAKEE